MNLWKKFWNWDGVASGEGGFLQAALTAAPYILQGVGALGGLFGGKKKYIDPEMFHQKYGPAAIAKNAQEIAQFILNSPYGQELMKSAAESGQSLQTELASRAAASGLSPDTGGESGASTFAAAAAPQAQAGLERQTRAGIWQAALPAAVQATQTEANLALGNLARQNEEPSLFQKLAAGAGAAGTTWKGILDAQPKKTKKPGEEVE